MVSRILRNRSARVRDSQCSANRSPDSGFCEFASVPWHRVQCPTYTCLPRSACAAVYTPSHTDDIDRAFCCGGPICATREMESAHGITLASHASPITLFQTCTREAVFRRKLDHPLPGPRAT